MKELKIYLLYSANNQPYDRDALGNFIRKLNDIFRDKQQNLYIRMVQCEDSHSEEDILSSSMFVTLSCADGNDFDMALQQFQRAHHPIILTFFDQQPSEDTTKFQNQLANIHGHYYTVYSNVENVQHKILMQLFLADSSIPITIENGCAKVADYEVLNMSNLPMFVKNQDFQELKAELADCYEEYLEAKQRSLDPANDPKVARKRKRWESARNDVQEMEQKLFDVALSFERHVGTMTMTPRQAAAYSAMEQGDLEKANAILDLNEIMEDIRHKTALSGILQADLCLHIDELLQKCSILKSQPFSAERRAQIIDIYRTAVEIEEKYNLPKRAMLAFLQMPVSPPAIWEELVDIAKRYHLYMQLSGNRTEIAQSYYLLGYHCNRARKDDEAMAAAKQADSLYEALREKDGDLHLDSHAKTLELLCHCLACSFYGNSYQIAVLQKVLQIYQRQEAKHPGQYLAKLCNCYHNLGSLYGGEQEKAEKMYRKSIELELELYRTATEADSDNVPWFIPFNAYDSLCMHYELFYPQSGKAEALRAEYTRQLESIALQDPEKMYLLADFHMRDFSEMLRKNKLDIARAAIEKAFAIWKNHPALKTDRRIQHRLAMCYKDSAELYLKLENYVEAESAYLSALQIWNRLGEHKKAMSIHLALAELYSTISRQSEALNLLRPLKPELHLELEKSHASGTADMLSRCCALLADLYTQANCPKEAEENQKDADLYHTLYEDWAYGRRLDQGMPGPLNL